MLGRLDTRAVVCPDCSGTRRDRRNRKRLCPSCCGRGTVQQCTSCGERMPCSGELSGVFDQTYCAKRGA